MSKPLTEDEDIHLKLCNLVMLVFSIHKNRICSSPQPHKFLSWIQNKNRTYSTLQVPGSMSRIQQNSFITVGVLIPEVDQVQQNLFITAVYTEFLSRISRISHQLYLHGYIVHGYQDNGLSTKQSPLISALFVRFLFMESR